MTKKQLRIPFKDGEPCKWVKDDHDEERDNYEFEEALRYTDSFVDALRL